MIRQALAWLFRSRETGAIVIGQWPNLPLWLFLGFTLAGLLADPQGRAGPVLRILATGSLSVWAAEEVVRGVNPWRRLLGGGVALWIALRLGGVL